MPFDIAGGITRSGASGSYVYAVIAGRGNMPVNYVSFYDALRFANWLHNGQPTGAQDDTTTEDGAYTITPEGIAANSIVRNPGAAFFLPSENEWYKAAYFKQGGVNAGYFDSPTRSNTYTNPAPPATPVYIGTACTVPTTLGNAANCGSAVGDLVNVGSYVNSMSPWVTFDQGGNVSEWNEAIINVWSRGVRGGAFGSLQILLGSGASVRGAGDPAAEGSSLGFRVARPGAIFTKGLLPQTVPALGSGGLLVVAMGLLAMRGLVRARV